MVKQQKFGYNISDESMENQKIKKTVSRREFIKRSTAAALGFNLIGCKSNKEKPNLLFLWTDQQRADTMGVYGNSKIQVPNLNKLARESAVFQNAYVSQPVCTPSRSTVMTGLWPHQNGCTENNVALRAEIPCLSEMVEDPDYTKAYYGKWHLGDEVFAQHGFDEWVSIEDGYAAHYGPARDPISVPRQMLHAARASWGEVEASSPDPDDFRAALERCAALSD